MDTYWKMSPNDYAFLCSGRRCRTYHSFRKCQHPRFGRIVGGHHSIWFWLLRSCTWRLVLSVFHLFQWRIQNLPEEGTPTPKVGAPTYYFDQFFLKTSWNFKKLDREGGRMSPPTPPPPPLGSANVFDSNKRPFPFDQVRVLGTRFPRD